MITLPNSPKVMAAVLLPLKEGRPVQFAMTGESMEPTIHGERDVIVLSPLPQALRRGDVVLYKRGMQHVLHRILRAKGDFLVVRGDSCREKERVSRDEVVALLVQIKHADGTVVSCCDNQWRSASRKAMRLNAMRQWGRRYFSKEMRNRFLPWYFLCLALLMWAPLGGLGLQLDNFVLGIRLDHLIHASVYIPCSWFFLDMEGLRRVRTLLLSFCVAMLTEGIQYFLPYRSFDINDFIANLFGIAVGWQIAGMLHRRLSRKEP